MSLNLEIKKVHILIKRLCNQQKIYITQHAWDSMEKRNITSNEIIGVIMNGEIIEEYFDDKPCPSCLIFGLVRSRPLHAVVALCKNHIRIITAYFPSPIEWIDSKIRKKKGGK